MTKTEITLTPDAVAMTIGGSDPSGGAGIQADRKAFQQNGVYGTSVLTLVTVQNTIELRSLTMVDPNQIRDQFDAVMNDLPPLAIKTGALGDAATVRLVAELLTDFEGPIIVDPVIVSKHGRSLADDDAVDAYREHLFPRATLVTPNRHETGRLVGRVLDDLQSAVDAAGELRTTGPRFVLIKAGSFDGSREHVYADADRVVSIAVPDHDTDQTHGAGCSLSAVITARLALAGGDRSAAMNDAVHFAVAAVNVAIAHAPGLGRGTGPIESRLLHLGRPT